MKQSSTFRIDERVVYTMAATCILSIILLAFKFVSTGREVPVTILHQDSIFVNSQAQFKALVKKGKTYLWDFGDGSIEQYTDSAATHVYKASGTYIVMLTVDGENKEIIKQDVYRAPVVEEKSVEYVLSYKDPSNVNEPVSFSVNTAKNTALEWYFDGDAQPSGTDNPQIKIFAIKGSKKIEVKLNPRTDKEQVLTRYINIIDKEIAPTSNDNATTPVNNLNNGQKPRAPIKVEALPVSPALTTKENNEGAKTDIPKPEVPKPKPVVKTAPTLSQDSLELMLHQIKTKNLPIAAFNPFFCDDLNIMITVDNAAMNFKVLYDKIAGFDKDKKAKKIKVIGLSDIPDTHCIYTFTIEL